MLLSTASSSRHRNDMATIFDVFCEIGSNNGDSPIIITKYPEDYNDESVLSSVTKFSFPCPMTSSDGDAVQLFSFVLTDAQSQFTFGYCRYAPRNNTCITITSGYSWPTVFYKILNHISLVMNNGTQSDMDMVLTRIYHTDLPSPGDRLRFEAGIGNHILEVEVPHANQLPTLREDKYMLEFYNAVSHKQMLAMYASLLKERRIVFKGRKLSQLSSCIYAATTLLYPMFWQSVFIPVLPAALGDVLMAPMPFLIGVPKQIITPAIQRELGEVVVIDLEEKTLESAHDDVAELPMEVLNYLRSQLKNSTDMGDWLARAFMKANAMLFGGYRMGFVRNESNGTITWDKEKFVREQRASFQPFLSSLIGADGVQYLERFIEERLRALNAGVPITGEFEKEITAMEGKLKMQVKENASDVIGALKDKVSGIQLGSKFNKLTPKEGRKPMNWTIKRKKDAGFKPMSFDNVQWQEPDSSDSSPDREPSPSEIPSTTHGNSAIVPVANLIDFDTPVSQVPTSSHRISPQAEMGRSTFYDASSVPRPSIVAPRPFSALPAPGAVDPFFDPFKTPTSPSNDFAISSVAPSVAARPMSAGALGTSSRVMSTASPSSHTAWEKFD